MWLNQMNFSLFLKNKILLHVVRYNMTVGKFILFCLMSTCIKSILQPNKL